MRELIRKIWHKVVNRETISYIIFGILTTLVNIVIYRLFDGLFSDGQADNSIAADVDAFTASVNTFLEKGFAGLIAWVVAVAFAYVTNRTWVFSERAQGAKNIAVECGKFVGARVLTGIIEILGVPLLVVLGLKAQIFGLDVAKLVVSVIIIVLNYVFSKLFVFKDKKNV